MNTKWLKIATVAVILGLIGFAAVVANAQGPGSGQGWGGYGNSLVATAADALGMEQADLVAELQGGKTIAELAEAKGIALDTIVDAFLKDHAARMADRVAAGWITQESADAMLALMKTHVTDVLSQSFTGQNFGLGMQGGMMGRGAMGHGMQGGMMGRGMHGMGPGMGFGDADGNGWCDHCPNLSGTTGGI